MAALDSGDEYEGFGDSLVPFGHPYMTIWRALAVTLYPSHGITLPEGECSLHVPMRRRPCGAEGLPALHPPGIS